MSGPARPSPDPALAALQERLDALEAKACWTDDLLDHLNRQVAEQQARIDSLTREVVRLRQSQADAQPEGFRSLRDELPPHY